MAIIALGTRRVLESQDLRRWTFDGIHSMDKQAPVVIAKVSTENEASVIKSLLRSYDIPCHYTAGLPSNLYNFSQPDPAWINIYVPQRFEQDARSILEEHRGNQSPLCLVDD